MKTREDRHVGVSHRRWLTPALLLTLAVAGWLIISGSHGAVIQATVDSRTARVIAAQWWGIPIGAALWLVLGVAMVLFGALMSYRTPTPRRSRPATVLPPDNAL